MSSNHTFRSIQDERTAQLLERIKNRELSVQDRQLLQNLKLIKDMLEPYLDGNLAILLQKSAEFRFVYIADGVVSITHTAQEQGVSTSEISKELKARGYEIQYDRNRKYCKDRVITYAIVKTEKSR